MIENPDNPFRGCRFVRDSPATVVSKFCLVEDKLTEDVIRPMKETAVEGQSSEKRPQSSAPWIAV
jgi:hypothetical protein